MKVSDIMTKNVIKIHPDESAEVAARTLTHYNIGALPVCTDDGKLCGMVTDRDLVYTKTKNPQAGPYWDRALKAAEMPAMQADLQRYVNRKAGKR